MWEQLKVNFLIVATTALLTACGGGGGESTQEPSPAPAPAPVPTPGPTPTPTPGPMSADVDRTKSQWYVSSSTSSIDGVKTTQMFAAGPDGADFFIYCNSKGQKGYYIKTAFITGSGFVKFRIGHNPVHTQTWLESSSAGFKLLTPTVFDISILKQLYQNWDFVSQLDKFGTGVITVGFRSTGFAAAIDKTRADCGWSTEMFPVGNGWSKEFPDVAPSNAVEATYAPNAKSQFGLIAWRDKNSAGKQQLLVRVGENKGLCRGSTVIDDRKLYVLQDGKRVTATSGTDFSLSCVSALPATFALQGDFDASRPFTLNAYPFHYDTLNPGEPVASVTLN